MKRNFLTSHSWFVLSLSMLVIFGLAGCQSSSTEEEPESDTGSEFSDAGASTPAPEPVPDTTVSARVLSIDPVYFDFDRSDIRQDAMPTLKSAARDLNDGGQRIVVEGHTDNRGSEEYNLALGERRASSVRRYLSNLGVPMSQMTIVSYGEIRPAAAGNTESAWALNRRAEFKVSR